MSPRLARTVRSDRFVVRVNHDFDAVLDGCAEPAPGRTRTWINGRIRTLYRKLFDIGHCHSVEAYENGTLVGGLYGVSLGRAFFGESMFHRARDASKVALVHLVARLNAGGFRLLDAQYVTDHLKIFGAIEVPKHDYHKLLEAALVGEADFGAVPIDQALAGAEALRLASIQIEGRASDSAPCRAAAGAAYRAAAAAVPGRAARLLRLALLLRTRRRCAAGVGSGGASAVTAGVAPLQSVSQTS